MDGGNAGNVGRLYGYRRLKKSVTYFPAFASAYLFPDATDIPKLPGNTGFSKTRSNHIQGMKPKDQSLVQGFITKKMVASRLALRELS